MRIRIVTEINASADTAWRAVHTPAVAQKVYQPYLRMSPIGTAFPAEFRSGDSLRVRLLAFGIVPVGTQSIVIRDDLSLQRSDLTRTLIDEGRPLTGPLAGLRLWRHEITITSLDERRSVWKDQLTIGGRLAPLFWPVLAVTWQLRRRKLRKLALTFHA